MINNVYIYVDDSGNINLTSSEEHFIYGAIVFLSEEKNKIFNEKYNLFLQKYNISKEPKGSHNLNPLIKKELLDILTSTADGLFCIDADKNKILKLKYIELEFLDNKTKQKKNSSKIREKKYMNQRTYILSKLIAKIIEKYQLNDKNINIFIDHDHFTILDNNNWNKYFNQSQSTTHNYSNNYIVSISDSKHNFAIQGADFLVNSIYKKTNKLDNKFYKYIDSQLMIYYFKHPTN